MNPQETDVSTAPHVVSLTRMQRTIARRMVAAKQEIPDFAAEVDVDMTAVASARERCKADATFVPSFNDAVIKASASALATVPEVNSSFTDTGFEYHDRINIGVAVAAERALVVPTITDADRKSLEEIGRESRALSEKVREGTIQAHELADQTFTVSNLGMLGVPRFTAVISAPQAAILAVGKIEERVVPVDGRPAVRPLMTVSLSSDHRVVYGADAARFLTAFREALERPETIGFTPAPPGEEQTIG
jgi:pyruvate dehydrogenase E2 component (dihydrolipoamide acetyltransferase)